DVQPQEDGSYLVRGAMSLRDLNRRLQWHLPTEESRTVNGLILEYLEDIPEPGTSLMLNGYMIEIVRTRGTAVDVARIRPGTAEAQAAPAEPPSCRFPSRLCPRLRDVREPEIDVARRHVAGGNIVPVPEIPHRFEKLGLLGAVLQVIRVFPGVEHHQRQAALRGLRLMIVYLHDDQPRARGIPRERRPSGTHDGAGGAHHLVLEAVERAEVGIDLAGQRAVRPPAALRAQVLPEQ